MKNKVYALPTQRFANLQDTIEEFQKNLPENEEIISTAINAKWLVVTVRVIEENKKGRNLLLESTRRKNQ